MSDGVICLLTGLAGLAIGMALEIFLVWLINYIPYKREQKRRDMLWKKRCEIAERKFRARENNRKEEEKTNETRNQN